MYLKKRLRIRQPFTVLTCLVFYVLVFCALEYPRVDFDAAAYHLPFARGVWGLPKDPAHSLSPDQESVVMPGLYYYTLGFPKVAETIQGFFWIVTGGLGGVALPQILLFVAYLGVARALFKVPISFICAGCCACPILFIHLLSVYVDIFTNLCLTLGFLLLSKYAWNFRRCPSFGERCFIFGCGMLVLASNSKTTAMIFSFFFIGVIVVQILTCGQVPFSSRLKPVIVLGFVGLFCSLVPLKNYVEYRNPLYPVEIKSKDRTLFAGPVPQYVRLPEYPTSALNSRPIIYLLSATELDWAIRGVPVHYSLDGYVFPAPLVGKSAWTGGFGGYYFTLLCVIIISGFLRYQSLPDSFTRFCLIQVLFLMAFVLFFPQSFELRYWLIVPLVFIPLALKLSMTNRTMLTAIKVVIGSILVYNLCLVYISFHQSSL